MSSRLEAGVTGWYLFDLDRDTVLEEPGDHRDEHPLNAYDEAPMHHEGKYTLGHPQTCREAHQERLPEAARCSRGRKAPPSLLDGTERELRRCPPTTASASPTFGGSTSSLPTSATSWTGLSTRTISKKRLSITHRRSLVSTRITQRKCRRSSACDRSLPASPGACSSSSSRRSRLPVVALRRILGRLVIRKRAAEHSADLQSWAADDLLFVSNYGEGDRRQIAFAHFSTPQAKADLPTLKVLGWDNLDTPLHLDDVARKLTDHLAWPDNQDDTEAWRENWRAAFRLQHGEVIATSKVLSARLAELARAIRKRTSTALAIESDAGPLTQLMKAFQTALMDDLDAEGFAGHVRPNHSVRPALGAHR